MADPAKVETTTPPAAERMEGGAYEVIRARLDRGAADLRERLAKLNEDRRALFGAVETSLVSTERVTTAHNCIPRDLVPAGGHRFLFGYNVQLGLKSSIEVEDVFAAYDYDPAAHTFAPVEIRPLLDNGRFLEDFASVHKFYRTSVFTKFHRADPFLYMVMQVGRESTDVKCFKWKPRGDGTLEYLGNRFDHEYVYPPQQEFEWKRAHRDMHRSGMHPHISIEDRVFIETVGGDLTVKIEDNTETGQGIYTEPVTDSDQTLDDAEIHYAIVGSLILLRVLPYQEKLHRYLVFNEKTSSVHRLDRIADACLLLPDDQGLVFPNGYLLQTGEVRVFDNAPAAMRFERRVVSGNGEDSLFVFHNLSSGEYLLLPYNRIEQRIDSLIACHGYTLFPNGEMLIFRASDQPQKHHAIQIWKTAFVAADAAVPVADEGSFLAKLGNPEIVGCMSECREVLTLLLKDDTYAGLYLDLVKETGDIIDAFWWLGKPEAHDLKSALVGIREAAGGAIDEFEKVQRLRAAATEKMNAVTALAEPALKAAAAGGDSLESFVKQLAALRAARGEILAAREVRYVDAQALGALDAKVAETADNVSRRTVEFLLQPQALDPYRERIAQAQKTSAEVAKVTDAKAIEEQFDAAGGELEMLIEILGTLKIDDGTQTTRILDDISTIYSTLNQARADLRNRRRNLAKQEGSAEYHAQVRLLGQSVSNYLDLSQSAEQCDELLTRLMVQVEELEGKFSEFDEYIEELGAKREEIYAAFENRKQSLLDKKQKRAETLLRSGERILTGVQQRLARLKSIAEISGYLATDLMPAKLREVIDELNALGDPVKAGDLQTRLKTVEQEAVRQLKDRSELFVEGEDVIQLGRHRFRANQQEPELSIILREGAPGFHISGTNYFEPIEDESFLSYREFWDQELVSENRAVYRAEYLAARALEAMDAGRFPAEYATLDEAGRIEAVRKFAADRHDEGYIRGVHDHDAALLLDALAEMRGSLGLLRFAADTRAFALLFWHAHAARPDHESFSLRLQMLGETRRASAGGNPLQELVISELEAGLTQFAEGCAGRLPFAPRPKAAARYLYDELTVDAEFSVSYEAAELLAAFRHELVKRHSAERFQEAIEKLGDAGQGTDASGAAVDAFQLAIDAVQSFARSPSEREFAPEAAAHLLHGYQLRKAVPIPLERQILGLKGAHTLIDSEQGGRYALHFTHFSERLTQYMESVVPRYRAWIELRVKRIDTRRGELRPGQFKPKVMSTFVRNRLINDVYLPLVGDNLAKQIGTAGVETRTDRMGMLLLISPPGYGKTTLLEYIASRLGLLFVKINGPAFGHRVTSLDPAEAPNAAAREEIEKLNLALEMGDNVLICVDDIQHTNAEFLQKFISLCDAQRRIEGVWKGKARTYDLRGRRVAVVMAGNPYTESGGKFQIPDMLANRADTYNLGDIAGGHDAAFKASYIENALTSNPALSRLAASSQKDVYALIRVAETGSQEGMELEGSYAQAEIEEMVRVLTKLFAVRDTILRVNLEYIRSAAQADAYRTEPPFRLQGSYRNMNRIAEKIIPLMTDQEARAVVGAHYQNEAQTLTTGAEANLLKFKEMEGVQTETETARWEEIRKTFRRNLLTGGGGDQDPVTRVVGQLSAFSKGLEDIRESLLAAGREHAKPQTLAVETVAQLTEIISGLRAVPVNVEIKVVPVEQQSGGGQTGAKEKRAAGQVTPLPEVPVEIETRTKQGDEKA